MFEVKNANSEILVDLSDTSVVDWTYHAFSFDITSHNTDITVTFTNNHSIAIEEGTAGEEDRTVFFDMVELKKQTPSSVLSNSYQFNYNTQLDVSSSSDTISVFKPYNYTLEYIDDTNNFQQLTNDKGNWAFDFKSGIITFGNDPDDDLEGETTTFDIGSHDLYFTFVKYVGLRGVNNLDTINGDLSVGRGMRVGFSTNYGYIADILDVDGSVNVGGRITMNGSDFKMWNITRGGGNTSDGRVLVRHTINQSDYSKGNSILRINYNLILGLAHK